MSLPFTASVLLTASLAMSISVAQTASQALASGTPTDANGGIAVHVTDETDAVIWRAKIDITDGSGHSQKTGQTDDSGFFQAANLRPGTYVLRVELLGFKPIKENFEVSPGKVTDARLTMVIQGTTDGPFLDLSVALEEPNVPFQIEPRLVSEPKSNTKKACSPAKSKQ